MTATSSPIILSVTGPEARASCRRASAIGKKVLVDVSEVACAGGFRWPVAVTARTWEAITGYEVADYSEDTEYRFPRVHHALNTRLYDALWQAAVAVRVHHDQREDNAVFYQTVLLYGRQPCITLKIVGEVGDIGEPVITIMLADEEGWR